MANNFIQIVYKTTENNTAIKNAITFIFIQ